MKSLSRILKNRCTIAGLTMVVLLIGSVLPALAQGPQVYRGAQASELVTPYIFEGDLRVLPKVAGWKPGDPIKEIPRRTRPQPAGKLLQDREAPEPKRDPLLDLQAGVTSTKNLAQFSTPDLNFDGLGFSGVNPPDTVGDVGRNYYIQMINDSGGAIYNVYDKTTGNLVAGPTQLDSLGSGFCANGLGDPIALYDQFADRWMLSEFSSSGNRLCVYISQTSDPLTGGFYAYDFAAPSFPDYPKYGVWPDAYYISSNESSTAAYALDRTQMLQGLPASFQRLTVPDLGGFGFQALTPSDADGVTAPPAGAPNYFMRHRDDESHNSGPDGSQDFLEIWEFSVDFNNSSNTTLTGPFNISVAEFDSSLCGLLSFSCIAQPGTNTRLDPLREVVMWRLQYRNFGTHETLVGNLATDVSGSDQAGIRWFELRKSGTGNWALFQEGTYAPDSNSRWMGSSAMDGSGNIAVGYNVSSSSTFPGLRYAGRLATDPSGTLPQGEVTLVNGTASNASNRYGDYASMNVDPDDDCTFWFTGEYNNASTWSTRIGSFKFDSCGVPQECGNNVIEGSEVCDGTDLGGATCGDQGCGGGTLACNATCNGFDTSGCFDCPVCDNDGICEAGEDCNSCPNDCVSGTTSGASCGNGICEAADGEDCLTCAADCAGQQSGRPANRFCCGGGGGTNPVDCSDARCSTGGFACTTVPVIPGGFCCGDGFCDAGESCSNCSLDCSAGFEICSDGIDNDCNGFVDCDDAACSGDPIACPTCSGSGASCSSNGDCCSGKCKGNGTCR